MALERDNLNYFWDFSKWSRRKGDKKISEEKESPMKLLTTSMHDAEILYGR